MNLGSHLTPHTHINLQGIKDPKLRAKAIKLLEEKIEVNLHDLRFGNGFLDMTVQAQARKEKIAKLDHQN